MGQGPRPWPNVAPCLDGEFQDGQTRRREFGREALQILGGATARQFPGKVMQVGVMPHQHDGLDCVGQPPQPFQQRSFARQVQSPLTVDRDFRRIMAKLRRDKVERIDRPPRRGAQDAVRPEPVLPELPPDQGCRPGASGRQGPVMIGQGRIVPG